MPPLSVASVISALKIDCEWVSPEGARGEELRATWARIHISIGGEVVTRCLDSAISSLRDSIYVPAYPLAEWVVWNWWTLFWEVRNERRLSPLLYRSRHSIKSASEGYALPDLAVIPDGSNIILNWSERDWPDAGLRFVGTGTQSATKSAVIAIFRQFVDLVVERLVNQGIQETQLQKEWSAIGRLDHDETTFCEVCGGLGRDPFNISSKEKAALLELEKILPGDSLREFVASVPSGKICEAAKALPSFAKLLERRAASIEPLIQFSANYDINLNADRQEPWRYGYKLARAFRERRSIESLSSDHALSRALGVDVNSSPGFWPEPFRELDAIVLIDDRHRVGFALPHKFRPLRRFTICRMAFDVLMSLSSGKAAQPAIAVVDSSHTVRQKANRAFAAELLAPAEQLRSYFDGVSRADQESIDEVASEFGVSTWVVRYQLANHNILHGFEGVGRYESYL